MGNNGQKKTGRSESIDSYTKKTRAQSFGISKWSYSGKKKKEIEMQSFMEFLTKLTPGTAEDLIK